MATSLRKKTNLAFVFLKLKKKKFFSLDKAAGSLVPGAVFKQLGNSRLALLNSELLARIETRVSHLSPPPACGLDPVDT